METIGWLIAFIILVIVEAITLNLTTIWFAIGAGAAYLCALLGFGFPVQFTVFVIVSLALLFFTKPVAQKYAQKHFIKTNVEELIGQTAKTTSVINNAEGYGSAVLNGQEWTAVSSDDDIIIEPNTRVIVKEIRGVKLVVEKANATINEN
ncbi:MAG: NfeD family protein [Lachnospiraceae bacterium]|nr:NfeD family protein [Lachnospiraceae bacterium]